MAHINLDALNPEQLDELITRAVWTRAQMASDLGDPKRIIQEVFDSGYNSNGDPIPPKDMGFGMTAIIGVVKDRGAGGKHVCTLYSVRSSEDDLDEHWSWDEESPSFIDADTVKINGLRRSVSLHGLPSGALIIQHKMEWDGSRHERKSVEGFRVEHQYDDDGEVRSTKLHPVSKSLIRRLPPPPDRDE